MISYYQPHLLPFLKRKKNVTPRDIRELYYLSWEDALWEILPKLRVNHGDLIILPDFYCLDVIKNINEHGYKTYLYSLDDTLQISGERLIKLVETLKPKVVIMLYACGITPNIVSDIGSMEKLLSQSILIEDQVQRVVDSSSIKIIQGRHLIMSSLRKNLPLPGSFVYSSHETAKELSKPTIRSFSYTFRVTMLYYIYRVILILGVTLRSRRLVRAAHNTFLSPHDDLVGDSTNGNRGLPWIPRIHKHINHSKIRDQKHRQVNLYQKLLKDLVINHKKISIPKFTTKDHDELQSFPLIAKSPYFERIEKSLLPLNVWSQFSDSQWSKSRRVFYLPLGFHITINDQRLIAKTIIQSVQKS